VKSSADAEGQRSEGRLREARVEDPKSVETRKETQVFRGMVLLLLPTMPPEHPNLLAVLAGMPATSLLCKVRLAPARQSVARLTAHPSISTLHRAQPLGARTRPPVPPLSAGLAGCAPDTYQSPHLGARAMRARSPAEPARRRRPRSASRYVLGGSACSACSA
jgi:hypothetical protein